jgi:hypothetical protein
MVLHILQNCRRFKLAALTAAMAIGCGLACWSSSLSGQATADGTGAIDAPSGETAAPSAGRLREGDRLVDQAGYFKPTGDRFLFYTTADERRFRTLENLNLERIARRVSDSPDRLDWEITALVTEYQGANYLLITQAKLKARPIDDAR